MNQEQFNWTKYIIALLVTGLIFIGAIYLSNYFNEKKLESVREIENRMAIDILSSETQFALINSSSCKLITPNILSSELNDLASRVSYMEQNRSQNDAELLRLKKQYSLLQIKDFLLTERIQAQCGIKTASVLYFYSNLEACPECQKTATILTFLREKYPGLRVYAFDYNLDLSAIRTIISLNKIENNLPAIVVDDEVFYSLDSLESFEKAMPFLKTLKTATTTATTTTEKK